MHKHALGMLENTRDTEAGTAGEVEGQLATAVHLDVIPGSAAASHHRIDAAPIPWVPPCSADRRVREGSTAQKHEGLLPGPMASP